MSFTSYSQVECMSSCTTIDSLFLGVDTLCRILLTLPLILFTFANNYVDIGIFYIVNCQIEVIGQGTTLCSLIYILICTRLIIRLTIYCPCVSTTRSLYLVNHLRVVDCQVQYILATSSQWMCIYT